MIKSKKSLRQKNKLTGLANTDPSVSADFKGNRSKKVHELIIEYKCEKYHKIQEKYEN